MCLPARQKQTEILRLARRVVILFVTLLPFIKIDGLLSVVNKKMIPHNDPGDQERYLRTGKGRKMTTVA
jgi:hypothetical protein